MRCAGWAGGSGPGVLHMTRAVAGWGGGGWYVRCAGWAGGSGPVALHMTRAVCWAGGRGVVRCGGGKWAAYRCSLLGGGEGAGRGGWGSSLTHQYLLIAQANMDSSTVLFFREGHIHHAKRAQAVSPDYLNHQVHYHACEPKKH